VKTKCESLLELIFYNLDGSSVSSHVLS